jgi:TonB family protein
MIALWMLSAILFTLFVAIAAYWAEWMLRAAGRPARGAWLFALATGTIWPLLLPALRRAWPALAPTTPAPRTAMLDVVRIVPDRLNAGGAWMLAVDRILLIVWIILSAALVLRYAVLWLAVRRLRLGAERATMDGVEVLVSGDLGPAVVGLRDTAVLMPRAMLELDAPLRRLVLRHEEEHRRAGDSWVLLGLAVAVAAMPWNFPLWYIARRARLALEVDCDARVMAAGENVTRYVQVLLLAAQRNGAAPLTPMLVASRTHLERRIHAMHSVTSPRHPVRVLGAAAACLVAGFAACSSPITDEVSGSKAVATQAKTATPTKLPVRARQPYFEFRVEKQAQVMPGSPEPHYPDLLKKANMEGEVLAQFVVDTMGRVEVASLKVLKSTHPLFTKAVKDVLPDMRFAPAQVGGRKVKQMIQEPFTFALSR